MAIPRKGTRRIVVDSVAYRWRVRRKPTYNQACLGGWLTLAAEREAPGLPTLALWTEAHRPDAHVGDHPRVVVPPAVVAQAIRDALAAGWAEAPAGKPFERELLVAGLT